jgi:hypothetical protein
LRKGKNLKVVKKKFIKASENAQLLILQAIIKIFVNSSQEKIKTNNQRIILTHG